MLLIYIYIGVSVYCLLCVLFVFVCMISNQSTCKKPRHVVDLMKLDALLHKTQQGPCVKVPRLSMCRSITSLTH